MTKLTSYTAPIGRVFISLIFLLSGISKISAYEGTLADPAGGLGVGGLQHRHRVSVSREPRGSDPVHHVYEKYRHGRRLSVSGGEWRGRLVRGSVDR